MLMQICRLADSMTGVLVMCILSSSFSVIAGAVAIYGGDEDLEFNFGFVGHSQIEDPNKLKKEREYLELHEAKKNKKEKRRNDALKKIKDDKKALKKAKKARKKALKRKKKAEKALKKKRKQEKKLDKKRKNHHKKIKIQKEKLERQRLEQHKKRMAAKGIEIELPSLESKPLPDQTFSAEKSGDTPSKEDHVSVAEKVHMPGEKGVDAENENKEVTPLLAAPALVPNAAPTSSPTTSEKKLDQASNFSFDFSPGNKKSETDAANSNIENSNIHSSSESESESSSEEDEDGNPEDGNPDDGNPEDGNPDDGNPGGADKSSSSSEESESSSEESN